MRQETAEVASKSNGGPPAAQKQKQQEGRRAMSRAENINNDNMNSLQASVTPQAFFKHVLPLAQAVRGLGRLLQLSGWGSIAIKELVQLSETWQEMLEENPPRYHLHRYELDLFKTLAKRELLDARDIAGLGALLEHLGREASNSWSLWFIKEQETLEEISRGTAELANLYELLSELKEYIIQQEQKEEPTSVEG